MTTAQILQQLASQLDDLDYDRWLAEIGTRTDALVDELRFVHADRSPEWHLRADLGGCDRLRMVLPENRRLGRGGCRHSGSSAPTVTPRAAESVPQIRRRLRQHLD